MALEEKRKAVFGLEREAAQRMIVSAASILILIGLLTTSEFIIATFLVGEITQKAEFSTATFTPTPSLTLTIGGQIPTDATPTPTLYPQAQIEGVLSNCVESVLAIESPAHQDGVSGVVELIGTVNTGNVGSYKYEYSTMGEPDWQTIAAGSGVKISESLGNWYTRNLTAGPYMLRLVALDNDGNENSTCVIVVTVELQD